MFILSIIILNICVFINVDFIIFYLQVCIDTKDSMDSICYGSNYDINGYTAQLLAEVVY